MKESAHSQRSFLGAVGRTATFNLAATGVSAATGVLLARWLGPSVRGDYAAVTAYFGLASVFLELGLGSSVVFHVSKFRRMHRDYVLTAVVLLIPLALLGTMASAILAVTIFSDSPSLRAAFMLIPLSITATFLGAPASFALQSLSLVRWNIERISMPSLFVLLIIGARSMTTLNLSLVINLMSVSLVFQSALAWWLYARISSRVGRFRTENVRPMLRFGILNMSSTAPNVLNSRGDQIILALMVSSAALGQYAVAVSLSVLAAPLVMAFGHVAFPSLARGERILETIRAATRGSLLVSVVSVVLILVASPLLISALFGPGYQPVSRLLLVLAPGATVLVVNQVLGDILRGLGRPGVVAFCEWIGVISTVGGLVLLVPIMGAMGAALTSTFTYMMVYVILRRSVSRHALACGTALTQGTPPERLREF